jgi:hypothetical protein
MDSPLRREDSAQDMRECPLWLPNFPWSACDSRRRPRGVLREILTEAHQGAFGSRLARELLRKRA